MRKYILSFLIFCLSVAHYAFAQDTISFSWQKSYSKYIKFKNNIQTQVIVFWDKDAEPDTIEAFSDIFNILEHNYNTNLGTAEVTLVSLSEEDAFSAIDFKNSQINSISLSSKGALRYIDLSNNNIEELEINQTDLSELYIENNKIKNLPKEALSGVIYLNASNNCIDIQNVCDILEHARINQVKVLMSPQTAADTSCVNSSPIDISNIYRSDISKYIRVEARSYDGSDAGNGYPIAVVNFDTTTKIAKLQWLGSGRADIIAIYDSIKDAKTSIEMHYSVNFLPDSEARLSYISTFPMGLTPVFSPDIYDYTLEVQSFFNTINIMAEAKSPTATVKNTGYFEMGGLDTLLVNVICTAQDGSRKTYNITVTKKPQANEHEALASLIKLWPNPAVDQINIDGIELQIVEIYNAIGSKLHTYSNISTINISSLKSGLYTVVCTTKKGEKIAKQFVKQ